MSLTTIIGRGHSGTRAMSHTLSASGVYMGAKLNGAGDLLPPEAMYEACRVMARHVRYLGNLKWDFSKLHTMPIDPAFTRLIESFLSSVLGSTAEHRGWKLPETTLVLPWIVRLFPDINYIYWIRDPRDCILSGHLTDNLRDWGIEYDTDVTDVRHQRAISWKYQVEIVKATPKPKKWLKVRLEDLVLSQDATVARLSEFLGFPISKIPVKPEVVGRWRTAEGQHTFDFFKDDLRDNDYLDLEPAVS